MPREMQIRNFEGTRWTSTTSAATLKAPHGGSMGRLEALAGMAELDEMAGCSSCRARSLGGCSSCSRSSPRRTLNAFGPLPGLGVATPPHILKLEAEKDKRKTGTGKVYTEVGFTVAGADASFLGARIEPVQAGAKQGVQAEVYVFGQPPLETRSTAERAVEALKSLGMENVQVNVKTFPIAWAWAYDAADKSWTAYASNADAGPFQRLLDRSRGYRVQVDTPVMADIKDLPTTGSAVQVLGEFPRAMDVAERTRVINTFKPFRPLGADLFYAMRFYSVPKANSGWLWGVAALGGLAYWRSQR